MDGMWCRFILIGIAFAVCCTGYEDKYSCDFNGRWCNWLHKGVTGNCNWQIKDDEIQGNKGYAVLDGSDNCHAVLTWVFLWFPVNPKKLTFNYYVTGPGPYSLNVTSEKSFKPEWTCQIQPGPQKRVGYANPMRVSNQLVISAKVASGSQLIITQVWNNLQGHAVQSECPQVPSANTTKPICPIECYERYAQKLV